jgi:hypothetical protein
MTNQDRYGQLFRVVDARLRGLGLKTYTQQQIKASIAQAELDAYFKNDPDAALAASRKLGANYILRGSITSQAGVNPIVQVNEVSVNIDLTLSSVNGRMLSTVDAHSESYSGSDTLHTALAMMQERADPLEGNHVSSTLLIDRNRRSWFRRRPNALGAIGSDLGIGRERLADRGQQHLEQGQCRGRFDDVSGHSVRQRREKGSEARGDPGRSQEQ